MARFKSKEQLAKENREALELGEAAEASAISKGAQCDGSCADHDAEFC
jgi:hypothetical protein